ncbi:MAG: hypothetical protein ACLQU1_33885 [Bryobacteraceae bacterium]
MFKKVLVSDLISEGQRLLEALKRNRFSISAAAWYYLPESMEWRLVIVSPAADRSGPLAAYTRVQRVLAGTNPSQLTLTDIAVIGPSSQDFEDLRAIISGSGPTSTGSAMGRSRDMIFEDSYVYRV